MRSRYSRQRYQSSGSHVERMRDFSKPQPAVPSRQRRPVGLCSWLHALKVFANFPPGPPPYWENGANLIWLAPLPVPGKRAGPLAPEQIWLHQNAQGSWAEGDSAFASPFLLDDEWKQDLVSSSRSTVTSGGASIPKRVRPFLESTTVTRMDSLMKMLSPTFRERTSMINPSMMLLAATGPSMTLGRVALGVAGCHWASFRSRTWLIVQRALAWEYRASY